jgi:hypothetical protein
MVIKRLAPLSLAKIVGMLYVVLGLIFGATFSLAAMAGAFAFDQADTPLFFRFMGTGAVFMFPIFYGCLGFIVSLVAAWLYNILAGLVGGIEIEIQ